MPTFIRRIIFSSFLLSFIVAGFLIVFYGSGYQYHFQKKKIEKTGQVSIISKPKDALVSINDQVPLEWWEWLLGKTTVKTPARIINLLSGEYRIQVKKDGYEPWNGVIHIEAGKTLILDSIILLPQLKAESTYFNEDIRYVELLEKSLLIATSNELILFDQENGSAQTILTLKEPLKKLHLAPNKKNVLVSTGARDFILELKKPYVLRELRGVRGRFEALVWDTQSTIIAKDSMGIIRIAVNSELSYKQLLSKNVLSFSSIGKNVWYQIQEKDHSKLYLYSDALLQKKGFIADIPVAYELSEYFQDSNPIFSKGSEKFLFDRGVNPPQFIPLGNMARIIPSFSDIFYGMNEFEIFEFKKMPKGMLEKNLLTREGTALRDIFTLQPLPYIVFVQDNGYAGLVRVGDTTGNQRYRIPDVVDITLIKFDSSKKELYLVGVRNTKRGLYKIKIIE